jgi:hypothetical protein
MEAAMTSILESLKYNPLDALKYGPIALAALTALWVATLLTIELRRPQVRKGARSLLTTFMIFCFVLTGLSWALFLFDENGKQKIVAEKDAKITQIKTDLGAKIAEIEKDRDTKVGELEMKITGIEKERDKRLADIRELIVRVDGETINKMRLDYNPNGIDKNALRLIAKTLCSAVTDIYRAAGGLVPTYTCAAMQSGQQ